MQLVFSLPEGSKQPIYKQVCEALQQAIMAGRLRPGEKLPSSRELADSAKLSRFTVIRSYELLQAQGFIETVAGSGTFVTDKAAMEPLVAHSSPESGSKPKDAKAEQEPIEPLLSAFGKRMLYADTIEPADTELFQELNYGAPSIDQLPLRSWREALNKCARFEDKTLFQYVSDPLGYFHLREAIAAYLTRARSVQCTAQRIAIFSGAQSALDLVCRILLDPEDVVALENPGFPGARRILQTHGVEVLPVPVDKDGLVVAALERSLERPKTKIKLVYVTPSHQDPLGGGHVCAAQARASRVGKAQRCLYLRRRLRQRISLRREISACIAGA